MPGASPSNSCTVCRWTSKAGTWPPDASMWSVSPPCHVSEGSTSLVNEYCPGGIVTRELVPSVTTMVPAFRLGGCGPPSASNAPPSNMGTWQQPSTVARPWHGSHMDDGTPPSPRDKKSATRKWSVRVMPADGGTSEARDHPVDGADQARFDGGVRAGVTRRGDRIRKHGSSVRSAAALPPAADAGRGRTERTHEEGDGA